MTKVFISYSRKDIAFIQQLAADLKLADIDAWYDLSGLEGGTRWSREIEKAIKASQYIIVILSPNAVESTWVEEEIIYARKLNKKIIPLLYKLCEIPLGLNTVNFIDVRDNEYQHKYKDILRALGVGRSEREEAEKIFLEKVVTSEKTYLKSVSTAYWASGFTILVLGVVVFSFLNNSSQLFKPTPENIQEQVIYTSTETEIVMPSETSTFTLTPSPIIVITGTDTLTPTSYPSKIVDSKGVPMAFVPAGEFIMGSENGDIDAKSVHSVYLNSFYIDIYEVTNAFYKICISDNNGCSEPNSGYYQFFDYADHPVVNVTWFQADQYCRWRGGSLPTEAQWEKAARGTDGLTYPWGEEAGCNRANYHTCVGTTAKVGSYENGRSPYNIYDMAGNVWEWVADWYDDNYYQYSPPSNPAGPVTGKSRILRGGSWSYPMNDLPTYNRREAAPNSSRNVIGFRCVKGIP